MNKTVKQYDTHRVLTNKNSQTKMNCPFLKRETSQQQKTRRKHQHKNKK